MQPPPSGTTSGAYTIYSAANMLPRTDRELRTDWRLGRWTAAADRMLVHSVRTNRFRFDAVASDLRAQLRDATHSGVVGHWSPPIRLVTADECRFRWAEIDREICRLCG